VSWVYDFPTSWFFVGTLPVAEDHQLVRGVEVSVEVYLESDERWSSLRGRLMRLADLVAAEYGRRVIRFGNTEVAEVWELECADTMQDSLNLRFSVHLGDRLDPRTEMVRVYGPAPEVERVVASVNSVASAMIEAAFEAKYGGENLVLNEGASVTKARHLVFLSHNNREKDLAQRLAGELERQGIDVWLDAWEIQAGDSVVGKIEDGLRRCTVFIMILSSAFHGSQWCTDEYRAALSRAVDTGIPKVIPVLREDVPAPPLIGHIRRVDLREDDFYDDAVEELLNAIYGISPRPPR
jgi:hypothetical protein